MADSKKSWSDGNQYCFDQYGTSLATIRSDDDAQTLLDLFRQNGDYWVGLYDYAGDHTGWAWASGYPWFVTEAMHSVHKLVSVSSLRLSFVFCGDIISDDDDCSTLKYWSSGNPSNVHQRCGQIGWITTSITNFVDDDYCHESKNIVCDVEQGILSLPAAFGSDLKM